jgi:hypothetical protein
MLNASAVAAIVAPTSAATTKVTPVELRRYTLVGSPQPAKGLQRQIVINLLAAATSPVTIADLAPLASAAGLRAVGGVAPSVRYHLHHLCLLGQATWQ